MSSGRTGLCPPGYRRSGFTLVEMMITIAVAAVLLILAAPLYVDVREKSIVRGAAGDILAMGQRAKLEAAKRNSFVTVSIRVPTGATFPTSNWCIGLQTTEVGCDCINATCDIDQVSARALNGARLLAAANFAGGAGATTDFTVDPKIGMLRNLPAGGSVRVGSPTAKWDYRVQFNLSTTAQMQLCQPVGAGHKLTDYPDC